MQHKREEKIISQHQKLIKAAHELGCKENEKAFDEALKKVAKAKPVSESRKPKRS